jgi:AcrR family transcriptional regulator
MRTVYAVKGPVKPGPAQAGHYRRNSRRDTGPPASVLRAWGHGAPSGRGPQPTLSLDAIVGAAVGIAAREGVDAVAMSRVAQALGVGTMSLYRHVEGKRELLALMVDSVFAPVPPPPGPRERWRPALTRWAEAHLEVLRRHSWVVRVPIGGPPVTPNQVRWLEHGLSSLATTRLSGDEKLSVLLLMNGFVRNQAMLEADLAAVEPGAAVMQGMAGYGRVLAELIDVKRLPAIAGLVADASLGQTGAAHDDFEFGLERILDGVEALVNRRRQ